MRIDDYVDHGEQLVLALRQLEAIQSGQDLARHQAAIVGEGECAGYAAELPHGRGGGDALAGDVSEHDAEASAGEGERVVPVAADLVGGTGRLVVSGQLDPSDLGQSLGNQAALKLDRDPVLLLVPSDSVVCRTAAFPISPGTMPLAGPNA